MDFSDGEALLRASHVGHEAAVRLLLADSDARHALRGASPWCGRALRAAAKGGHCGVVRLLLDARADLEGELETEDENESGDSPLVLASSSGRLEVIRELLHRAAEIDRPSGGLTPLMAASASTASGASGALAALLAAGAEVNRRCEGATALLWDYRA
ncbi:unnamed protein product [Effrenium voratum]|nr:unnamed protein product [Effrenium voratum]